MIKTYARRLSLALILGATSLVAASTAHADGTTGTDPCPKGMLCTNAAPAKTAAPSSLAGTVAQIALLILGIS